MRRIAVALALLGALSLAAAPAVQAAAPLRSFAPGNCYHTVFAHTSGTQYGFTSCTSKHRISLIIGSGSAWRTVKLSIHGTPLAAADNGKLTYLLYTDRLGAVSLAWVGRMAAGVSAYEVQSLGGTVYSGGVIATTSGWRAVWSESADGDMWEKGSVGPIVVTHDRARYLSMATVNARVTVAWVTNGRLFAGRLTSSSLGRQSITSDKVGQPRVLSYRGHTAIAFPDYTTNTARLAVSQGGKWIFKTLGSLGTSHTSLVSVGWAGNGAVIAWQTPTGLRVARYVNGSWHTSVLSGAANKTLAYSGTAVLRPDGSALLLGRNTARVVG
jgi:hypothetical protein